MVNENPVEKLIRDLRDENDRLKRLLESMSASPGAQTLLELQQAAAAASAAYDCVVSFNRRCAARVSPRHNY